MERLPGKSDASVPPGVDLAALARAVQDDLARERGPMAWLRARSRPVRLALLALLVALDAFWFHHFMLRGDFATYAPVRLGTMLGICVLLIFAAAWQALRPLWQPPAPAWVTRLLVGLGLLVPVVFALLPEVPTARPGDFAYASYGWWCFSTGIAQAAAALLLLRVLDRRGRGADAGALLAVVAGGMLGMIGLLLYCPINYPLHLLTGHATVPLALVVGAWLRRATAR
jgi:hypothetical protein